jgi:two-component system chemotaxis response regulator CheY
LTTARPQADTTLVGASGLAGQTVARQPPATAPEQALTVLLVEPSRTQAGIIRRYLEAQHVGKVVTAASGREALAAARTHQPQVVLSAMHLTDMTGVELFTKVREACPGSPLGFILVSSEDESREAGTLGASGPALVLHKPFTPEQLAQALALATPRAG